MTSPIRPLAALAAVAVVEGAFLILYAIFDVVEAVRVGTSGPEEVSNAPALVLLVVIYALLGVGLVVVGLGWWRARRWARAPFILAQILAVIIGAQLAMSSGAVERTAGVLAALVGLVGLVLTFSPQVTKALTE